MKLKIYWKTKSSLLFFERVLTLRRWLVEKHNVVRNERLRWCLLEPLDCALLRARVECDLILLGG